MTKIILTLSPRRGVGRSSLIANFAHLLARENKRVGVLDMDFESPSLHHFFALAEKELGTTLLDSISGTCPIDDTAYHVATDLPGDVFLLPNKSKMYKTTDTVYDVEALYEQVQDLAGNLDLDTILLDTPPGISDESLFLMSMSDLLIIVLHTDKQDYQKTATAIELARKLNTPRTVLIINEVPSVFDFNEVKLSAVDNYQCEVAVVLPYLDEMMALGSRSIFSAKNPDHEVTDILTQTTKRFLL